MRAHAQASRHSRPHGLPEHGNHETRTLTHPPLGVKRRRHTKVHTPGVYPGRSGQPLMGAAWERRTA
eukprot:6146067-Alexandrium_andersonii.AAC.1